MSDSAKQNSGTASAVIVRLMGIYPGANIRCMKMNQKYKNQSITVIVTTISKGLNHV